MTVASIRLIGGLSKVARDSAGVARSSVKDSGMSAPPGLGSRPGEMAETTPGHQGGAEGTPAKPSSLRPREETSMPDTVHLEIDEASYKRFSRLALKVIDDYPEGS